MASTDHEPPSAAAGAAIHPLTRKDAASHARRYYARVTQKASGPKIDSYHTYRHLERDPAFTEAAAWPGYFLSFPDDDDAIFQMFRPPVSPELELWVLEYVRVQWPEKDLFGVMAITADRTLHPLHIAAAIGLPSLCQRIAEENKDSVNQLSVIGTPLYCALVGPTIFLQQGHGGSRSEELTNSRSIAKAETIHTLLDAGAGGLNMTRPRYNTTFSVQLLAFLECSSLNSPELFRRLYPPVPDILGIEVDLEFQKWVTASQFWSFDVYGLEHHSSKRVAENRRAYFELLLVTFDARFSEHVDGDNDYDLFRDIWAAIVRFWELGKYSTPLLSEPLPLHSTSDNQFQHLVRLAVGTGQDYVVERLSCDPRFDANLPLLGPDEIADDPDDEGATLLHSAVRIDSTPSAEILISRGADLKARDATGRTPLLLCESVGMLQLLTENGGETTDVDSLGRNIYHYAAACNDSVLLAYLIGNDTNRTQGMSTRMLSGGLTPAAQAIIYPLVTKRLTFGDFVRMDIVEALRGAKLLLRHGATIPGSLHSYDAVSLAEAALRWSDGDLVSGMRRCGFRFNQVDSQGENALHSLSFAATDKLIRHLAKDCATLPMLNHIGKSPLVTIFENTYISVWDPTGLQKNTKPMSHLVPKDFTGILDRQAYTELVKTTVAAASEGEAGEFRHALAGCFESFFNGIITGWLSDLGDRVDYPLSESLVIAMQVFEKYGVLRAYHKLRGKSPAADIARHFCAKKSADLRQNPWWRGVMLDLLYEAMDNLYEMAMSSLPKEDEMVFEDMLEWILSEPDGEASGKEISVLVEVLQLLNPLSAQIKGVPTMLAACRSRCAYDVFDRFLLCSPPLVNEEDIAAARACLKNGLSDGEKRLRLLDHHLEEAARRLKEEEVVEVEEGEGEDIPDEP